MVIYTKCCDIKLVCILTQFMCVCLCFFYFPHNEHLITSVKGTDQLLGLYVTTGFSSVREELEF
jgi:hypothetical protein